MGRLILIAAAVVGVLILGFAGFLAVYDLPPRGDPVEHVIPDAKLAR